MAERFCAAGESKFAAATKLGHLKIKEKHNGQACPDMTQTDLLSVMHVQCANQRYARMCRFHTAIIRAWCQDLCGTPNSVTLEWYLAVLSNCFILPIRICKNSDVCVQEQWVLLAFVKMRTAGLTVLSFACAADPLTGLGVPPDLQVLDLLHRNSSRGSGDQGDERPLPPPLQPQQ